jgi:hypothetical protein
MSFFRALFDFSFSEFVTPKIIKILYVIALILVGLASLGFMIAMFSQGGGWILLGLLFAPIMFVLYVIFVRVGYEILIVLFQIAENTRDMAWALTGGRKAPSAAPAQPQYPQYPQQAQYPQQQYPQQQPQSPQQPQQPPQYPQYPQQPPQYPPKP